MSKISIHAPHTGRDIFQLDVMITTFYYFNPRAPYGARLASSAGAFFASSISIHAPHTGRDEQLRQKDIQIAISIHAPHTGRDDVSVVEYKKAKISIHAPHTGRDSTASVATLDKNNFNPRAPYGARLKDGRFPIMLDKISIHAPHTGRDIIAVSSAHPSKSFQSTRPIRGATCRK